MSTLPNIIKYKFFPSFLATVAMVATMGCSSGDQDVKDPVQADATSSPGMVDDSTGTVNAELTDNGAPPLPPTPEASAVAGDLLASPPPVTPPPAVEPPPPAAAKATAAVLGKTAVFIVQPGDTLGKISREIYGDSHKWQSLADINGLTAPYAIFPGQALKYDGGHPKAKAYLKKSRENLGTVVVGTGDTLTKIAGRVLGSAARWKELMALNGDRITNPNRIYVGMKLFVPGSAPAVAASAPAAAAPTSSAKAPVGNAVGQPKKKKSASPSAPAE